MSFDDELRRVIDSLGDRLRHEAAGHFQGAMHDFHDAIDRDRDAAVITARAAAEEDAAVKIQETEARAQALESRMAESLSRITTLEARLHEAVAITQAQDAQITAAEQFVSAVRGPSATDVVVVQGELADLEARARQAEARVAEEEERAQDAASRVAELEAELEAALVISQHGEATGNDRKEEEHGNTHIRLAEGIRAIDTAASLSGLLDALANAARAESDAAAVLVMRGTQPRSWRLQGFGDALDTAEPFEMPMSDLGLVAQAAADARPVLGDSTVESSVPGFASLPPGRPMAAVPVVVGGQVIALVYGERAQATASPQGWIATLEVLARYAARSLEALTVLKTAGLVAQPVVEKATAIEDVEDVGGDDEAVGARRFARLLISEIKLYHEADVLMGRHDRNLLDRLGGEIARARMLYEQRVPVDVRTSGVDHFHAELIHTLAGGDESLLGRAAVLRT